MAVITVGDIRKAIKGMKDKDRVLLDVGDPPDGYDFRIDGVGRYGSTLQISISDHGDGDDDEDDEEEGTTPHYCQNCDHKGPESDFWPSDGSPAGLLCPECGSVDVYEQDEDDDGD